MSTPDLDLAVRILNQDLFKTYQKMAENARAITRLATEQKLLKEKQIQIRATIRRIEGKGAGK
jgi:hypothetical protein